MHNSKSRQKIRNTDVRLSLQTRLGYGVANIADTIILDFVSAFFLFFLTDLVGINPALAGSVASFSILWDAVTGPVIGNIADKTNVKSGRYRRFLMISILPVFICMILMFLKVNFGKNFVFLYYLIVSMLYYTAYSLFNIPYMALGSSLTSNEVEKTRLSGVRQSFGFAGALFSGAMPAVLIDAFQSGGIRDDLSYTVTAVILGFCSALVIFITWFSTRGKELDFHAAEESKPKAGLFSDLRDIFKCRPYILLLISAFIFYIGYAMVTGSIMYVITGILGLSEGASGGIFIILAGSGMLICAILSKLAEKFDKKAVYIVSVLISASGMLIIKLTGITSLAVFALYIIIVNISFSAFLMLINIFLYDIADIIDFKSGKRLTGAVCSYYSFVIKVGKAGAMQLVGLLLAAGGYNAALSSQTESGAAVILNIVTIYPAIIYIFSLLFIFIYPVSVKRISKLQKANVLKNKGERYDTSGFEELL